MGGGDEGALVGSLEGELPLSFSLSDERDEAIVDDGNGVF